jgi:hypothetical protein
MTWTIGKTYKDLRGVSYVIVAITPKGRLIGYEEETEVCVRWNCNGRKESSASPIYDLVNDEPTDEEKRFAHALGVLLAFERGSAMSDAFLSGDFSQLCRTSSEDKFHKVIEIIREIRRTAT